MKHLIGIILLLFCTTKSYADVYFFPDKDYHISLGLQFYDYSIDMTDEETNKHLVYKPNLQGLVTPRFTYKKIFGLSWGFKAGDNQKEELLFGKTEYTDARFDFSFNEITVNTFYTQYRGFFIDNSYAVDPTLTDEQARIQAPDMYSRFMGFALSWVQRPHTFSMPNLYDQSERQEKRGGSILIGMSFTETFVENATGLIHPDVRSEYDILANMTAAKFRTLNLKASYGWTWPFWRKWYVGGALQGGFGFLYKELKFLNSNTTTGWEPSFHGELLLASGYNGDDFFSNLKIDAMGDFLMLSGSSSRIVPAITSVSLNVGVHL